MFLQRLFSSVVAARPRPWTPKTERIGLLAVKKGMMSLWDDFGVRHAVTVLQVDNCHVIRTVKHPEKRRWIVEIGAGYRNPRRWHPIQKDLFMKAGVHSKKRITGFYVRHKSLVPSGTALYAGHFIPGQKVDVQAISIGKGFQGVVKRWGFKGGPASHGNSLNHRRTGSIGSRTDPGKVFKGKKMPGRMGGKNATVHNLTVMKIDHALNCIYVKGAVPGHDSCMVKVSDGRFFKFNPAHPPPFPTFFPDPSVTLEREAKAATLGRDPLLVNVEQPQK